MEKENKITKKNSNTKKIFLFGCISLLVVFCCICFLVSILSPNLFIKNIVGANNIDERGLTQINSQEESTQLKQNFDQKIDNAKNQTQQKQDKITLTFTEKEILAYFIKDLNLQPENLDSIKLDISQNNLIMTADVAKLLENFEKQNSTQNADYSIIKGIKVRAEMSTSSDNTKLSVDKITTGNSLLDNFIPIDIKTSMGDEITSILNNLLGDTSYKLETVVFEQDKITLNYSKI